MRVAFQVFVYALDFEAQAARVAEFASGLSPERLINIAVKDAAIVVWYWDQAPQGAA